MAENKIQFQKGLSIPEFISLYGTNELCQKALEKVRWPKGFMCSECGNTSYCYIKSRKYYQCNRCHDQTSVTRNTIFHSSNLPLSKWFLAVFLISQCKNGISSMELKRHIGVSYKTAWRIKQKLMQAMMERDSNYKLSEVVEIDDSYIGGERRGGKRGRGSENKRPFIAAVETTVNNRPLFTKLSMVKSFTKKEIQTWAEKNLAKGAYVLTDGLNCFNALTESGYVHHREVIGKGNRSTDNPSFNWVNTVLGNVKNSITGTYHSSRNGYGKRYLAEFQYRFNRRFNLRDILTRLISAAADTPPLPGKLLKLAVNCT